MHTKKNTTALWFAEPKRQIKIRGLSPRCFLNACSLCTEIMQSCMMELSATGHDIENPWNIDALGLCQVVRCWKQLSCLPAVSFLTLIDKTLRNDNLIITIAILIGRVTIPVIAQQAHQFLDCPGAISRRFEGPATWSRASTVTTDGFCWGTCLRIPEVNWIPKET